MRFLYVDERPQWVSSCHSTSDQVNFFFRPEGVIDAKGAARVHDLIVNALPEVLGSPTAESMKFAVSAREIVDSMLQRNLSPA